MSNFKGSPAKQEARRIRDKFSSILINSTKNNNKSNPMLDEKLKKVCLSHVLEIVDTLAKLKGTVNEITFYNEVYREIESFKKH